MKTWPVQDAKARFSEFLDACLADGPQMVTRRGVDTAVLVSASQWQQMRSAARPALKDLLLAEEARVEYLTPERSPNRGKARRRPVEAQR